MAELSLDIIVNAQDAETKTRRIASGIDQMGDQAQESANQFRSFNAQFNQFNTQFNQANTTFNVYTRGAGGAKRATDSLNRSVSNSSQIFFQAGQAISDFAVAGIRGAANNLEFLALQMGASGPLLIAIAGVTTALVVFGDDILKALDPAIDRAKTLQREIEKIAKSVPQEDISIPFLSEQVPGIINELEGKVSDLREELAELGVEAEKLLLGVAIPGSEEDLRRIEAINTQLVDVQKTLKFFRDEEEKQVDRILGAGALQNSEILKRNELLVQGLRDRARDLGLEEQIKSTSDEQLLLLIRQGEEEQFIADLKKKRAGSQKEELTELEKLTKKNEELLDLLDSLRRGQSDVLDDLRSQNQALQEQIRIVKALNAERSRLGGTLGADVQPVTGAGVQGADPFMERVRRQFEDVPVEDRLSAFTRGQLREAPSFEEFLEKNPEVREALEATAKSEEALIQKTQQLNDVIRGGLGSAFSAFAQSIGEGETVFDSLRTTVGNFAIDLGRTFIGFGLAGQAIKAFAAGNPALAFLAGGALIAAGSALKKTVEDKTESFIQSGSSRGAPVIRPVDPRQGRTGRLQRDVSSLIEQRPPSNIGNLNISGEFRQEGTSLVAVVERTQRRQRRTRG